MPATVFAERIGWQRGMTILKERVRELRLAYLPADPVSRTTYQPGRAGPVRPVVPGRGRPARLWAGRLVLVLVSGYSRAITARVLLSKNTWYLIDGHCQLLSTWDCARMLVWTTRPVSAASTSELAAFAGLLATKMCRPGDSEAKGLIERANGWPPVRTPLLWPQRLQPPAHSLAGRHQRVHRLLATRPVDRWEAEKAGMLALLPVDPPVWWRFATRIGRDHWRHPRDSDCVSGNLHRPKRYHRGLQRVFYTSAIISIRNCAESRRFYDRKRAEGKRHTQAVLALARRRVKVLWALLRDGRYYQAIPPVTTAA